MNTHVLSQRMRKEPYQGWGNVVGGIGCATLAAGSVIALGFISKVIALVAGVAPFAFVMIPFLSVPLWSILPVVLGIGALLFFMLAIVKIPSQYQEIRDVKTATQICELLETSSQLTTKELEERIPENFWNQFAEKTDENIQKYQGMFRFSQMRPLLARHVFYVPVYLDLESSKDLELVKLLCSIRPEFAAKISSSKEVLETWGGDHLIQFIDEFPELYVFFPFDDRDLADVFSENIEEFIRLVNTHPDLLEQRTGVMTSLAERDEIDLDSFAKQCVFQLPNRYHSDVQALVRFVQLNRAFFSQVKQNYQTLVLEYLSVEEILEILLGEERTVILPQKMFEPEGFASLVSICQKKERYILQLKNQVKIWSFDEWYDLFLACLESHVDILKFFDRKIVLEFSENYPIDQLMFFVDASLSPFPLLPEICSEEYLGWFLESEKRCRAFIESINQINENKAELISQILIHYPNLFFDLSLKAQGELYNRIGDELFVSYALQSPEKIILSKTIPLKVYLSIIESGISISLLSDRFVCDLLCRIQDFSTFIENFPDFISVFINCISENELLFYRDKIKVLYERGGKKERLKLISPKGPMFILDKNILINFSSMRKIISRDQRYVDQLLESGVLESDWEDSQVLDMLETLKEVMYFDGKHWIGAQCRLDMLFANEIPTVKGKRQIVRIDALRENFHLIVKVIGKDFKYFEGVGKALRDHPELVAWLCRIYPEHKNKILNKNRLVGGNYSIFLSGESPRNLPAFSREFTKSIDQNPGEALLEVMRHLGEGTPIVLFNKEIIYRYLLPRFNIGNGVDMGGPTRDACCSILHALFDPKREREISFIEKNGLILPSVTTERDVDLYKALGGFLYAIRMNQYRPIIGKIFHSVVFDILQSIKLSYLEEIINCECFENLSLKAIFSILVPFMKLSKRSDTPTIERYLNDLPWKWDIDVASIGGYLENLEIDDMAQLCYKRNRTEDENALLEKYIREDQETIFRSAFEIIDRDGFACGMFYLIQGFVKDRYVAEVVSSGLSNLEIDLQGEINISHFFDRCIRFEYCTEERKEKVLRAFKVWINEPLKDPDLDEQEQKVAQNMRLEKLIYFVTGSRSLPLNPSDQDKLKINYVRNSPQALVAHTCFRQLDITMDITEKELIFAFNQSLTNASFEDLGSYNIA